MPRPEHEVIELRPLTGHYQGPATVIGGRGGPGQTRCLKNAPSSRVVPCCEITREG